MRPFQLSVMCRKPKKKRSFRFSTFLNKEFKPGLREENTHAFVFAAGKTAAMWPWTWWASTGSHTWWNTERQDDAERPKQVTGQCVCVCAVPLAPGVTVWLSEGWDEGWGCYCVHVRETSKQGQMSRVSCHKSVCVCVCLFMCVKWTAANQLNILPVSDFWGQTKWLKPEMRANVPISPQTHTLVCCYHECVASTYCVCTCV